MVGLTEQRRRGPVSVLPSLQPLIKGANVVPWPALLASLVSPPKLKGGGAIDEADVNGDGDEVEALFGGGEFKQPDQVDTKRSRARRRAKRKKRVQALSFHFKFPLQRLLAHGICQFHGLTSKSVGDGNCRVFRVVKLKKASRRDNPSKVTIAHDLAALLFQTGEKGGPTLDEHWDSSTAQLKVAARSFPL